MNDKVQIPEFFRKLCNKRINDPAAIKKYFELKEKRQLIVNKSIPQG